MYKTVYILWFFLNAQIWNINIVIILSTLDVAPLSLKATTESCINKQTSSISSISAKTFLAALFTLYMVKSTEKAFGKHRAQVWNKYIKKGTYSDKGAKKNRVRHWAAGDWFLCKVFLVPLQKRFPVECVGGPWDQPTEHRNLKLAYQMFDCWSGRWQQVKTSKAGAKRKGKQAAAHSYESSLISPWHSFYGVCVFSVAGSVNGHRPSGGCTEGVNNSANLKTRFF